MILALPLIRLAIFFIWVVDVLTNFNAVKISKRLGKAAIIFLSVSFAGFLTYSYFSGYLNKIAVGLLIPEVNLNSGIFPTSRPPVLVHKQPLPPVTARSFVVVNLNEGNILSSFNSGLRLASASTTKLVTALVALDLYNLDEVIKVPESCTVIDSTKIWLPQKYKFKVKDLIYTMLIGSAGDSACVLANGKVPYDRFVNLMNRKAFIIGLGDTHFSNPIGLDGIDGNNYSTATDLYKLAVEAMKNKTIAEAVKSKDYQISDTENKYATRVLSTNQLLWEIPNTIGVKTGTTESAGEVFIYDYATTKVNLMIVVMGSKDRFADTKALLNWALSSYTWN